MGEEEEGRVSTRLFLYRQLKMSFRGSKSAGGADRWGEGIRLSERVKPRRQEEQAARTLSLRRPESPSLLSTHRALKGRRGEKKPTREVSERQ